MLEFLTRLQGYSKLLAVQQQNNEKRYSVLLVIQKQLLNNLGFYVDELSRINEPFVPRSDVKLALVFSMFNNILYQETYVTAVILMENKFMGMMSEG